LEVKQRSNVVLTFFIELDISNFGYLLIFGFFLNCAKFKPDWTFTNFVCFSGNMPTIGQPLYNFLAGQAIFRQSLVSDQVTLKRQPIELKAFLVMFFGNLRQGKDNLQISK
jgi:hypothetical protein